MFTAGAGTLTFAAPERLTNYISGYDEKVDVWSAGTVLYMMLTGESPFESDNMALCVKNITQCEPDYSKIPLEMMEASSLIQYMLQKDPKHRPSI